MNRIKASIGTTGARLITTVSSLKQSGSSTSLHHHCVVSFNELTYGFRILFLCCDHTLVVFISLYISYSWNDALIPILPMIKPSCNENSKPTLVHMPTLFGQLVNKIIKEVIQTPEKKLIWFRGFTVIGV